MKEIGIVDAYTANCWSSLAYCIIIFFLFFFNSTLVYMCVCEMCIRIAKS